MPEHDNPDRFLRKKLIGKTVNVYIDYVKPKEGDYDEKECVTVRYGGAHRWVCRRSDIDPLTAC